MDRKREPIPKRSPVLPLDILYAIFTEGCRTQEEQVHFDIMASWYNEFVDRRKVFNGLFHPHDWWKSALKTRASVVRVNRSWYQVGTPFLYSSFIFTNHTPHQNQIFAATCLSKPHLASYIQHLEVHVYGDFISELLPLCTQLKRFFSYGDIPTRPVFYGTIRDLNFALPFHTLASLVNAVAGLECLERLRVKFFWLLGAEPDRTLKFHFRLPKLRILHIDFVNPPAQRVLQPPEVYFNCPRLKLLVYKYEKEYSTDLNFKFNVPNLSHLSIGIGHLYHIEQKQPTIFLNSRLKCLQLTVDSRYQPKILTKELPNLEVFAIDAFNIHISSDLLGLFGFLCDESLTPRLRSVYLGKVKDIWAKPEMELDEIIRRLSTFAEFIHRRGVDLYAEKDPRGKRELIHSKEDIRNMFNEPWRRYESNDSIFEYEDEEDFNNSLDMDEEFE